MNSSGLNVLATSHPHSAVHDNQIEDSPSFPTILDCSLTTEDSFVRFQHPFLLARDANGDKRIRNICWSVHIFFDDACVGRSGAISDRRYQFCRSSLPNLGMSIKLSESALLSPRYRTLPSKVPATATQIYHFQILGWRAAHDSLPYPQARIWYARTARMVSTARPGILIWVVPSLRVIYILTRVVKPCPGLRLIRPRCSTQICPTRSLVFESARVV